MRIAMIGVPTCGYVAELAAPIGGPKLCCCYRICYSEGAAFTGKIDMSTRPHILR